MRLSWSHPILLYRPAEPKASAMICKALNDILIGFTGAAPTRFKVSAVIQSQWLSPLACSTFLFLLALHVDWHLGV
jgi:hypothetical protein